MTDEYHFALSRDVNKQNSILGIECLLHIHDTPLYYQKMTVEIGVHAETIIGRNKMKESMNIALLGFTASA